MSIRREQEHVSLALTAVVQNPSSYRPLPKRRCNERLQTSLYDLVVFRSRVPPAFDFSPSDSSDGLDRVTLPESGDESSS
jgi:hypothetical protein